MKRITEHTISTMPRDDCVALLERYGFVCYDGESVAELRVAIMTEVIDGTIPESEIENG